MSFWDWAVDVYGRDGVADICLELQDAAGQNVPLILWAAWSGEVDPDRIEEAVEIARAWDETAVGPLRAVRRALKPRRLDMDDGARESVRAQVKAVELFAERALMTALGAVSSPSPAPGAPLTAMAAAAKAWNGQVPRDGLTRLAQRLSANGSNAI